jgi:hypothetical protein
VAGEGVDESGAGDASVSLFVFLWFLLVTFAFEASFVKRLLEARRISRKINMADFVVSISYPEFRGGKLVSLFFLPAGRISYTANPDDPQPISI